jgi:hypothetical protein
MEMVIGIISGMLAKYPAVASILAVVGSFRLVLKPIREAIVAIVGATPTTKDNDMLAKVESSKVWKAVVFVADLIFSVKLPK